MRSKAWCCASAAVWLLLGAPIFAAADDNAGNCYGLDFLGHGFATHPVTIAKIIADRPQVHFLKNAFVDPACPSERASCEEPSYVVPGNLVLVGKTHGAFSCAFYQSPAERKIDWSDGWLPSASLTPVQRAQASEPRDWIGRWIHADIVIAISKGRRGALRIRGESLHPPRRESYYFRGIDAEATPAHGLMQFAGDGSVSFDVASAKDVACLVRMQRIADLLVVEDNGDCGGGIRTFSGFYRRKR